MGCVHGVRAWRGVQGAVQGLVRLLNGRCYTDAAVVVQACNAISNLSMLEVQLCLLMLVAVILAVAFGCWFWLLF